MTRAQQEAFETYRDDLACDVLTDVTAAAGAVSALGSAEHAQPLAALLKAARVQLENALATIEQAQQKIGDGEPDVGF